MKKSLIIFTTFLMAICCFFVGCAGPKVQYDYPPDEFYTLWVDTLGNEYKIDFSHEEGKEVEIVEYPLEFLACYNTYFSLGLKGLYAMDGTPLNADFYPEEVFWNQIIDFSFVGTTMVEIECPIYYTSDGSKQNHYEIEFHFPVTVKPDKTLHTYVTMRDAEIPYDYFACEMQEVAADAYNWRDFQDILGGDNNTDDYEYGYLGQQFSSDGIDADLVSYSSQISKQQTKEGIVWETEMFHSVDLNGSVGWEIYQYTQIKGKDPHELNPAYLLNETDGVFTASTYKQGGYRGWSDYLPAELEVVREGTDLKYKMGAKDGYLYLSISGILQNFWYPRATIITATYKIQDKKIVAWLFEEKDVAADEYGYWTRARYCIPLEGEIELLDEELLASVCVKNEEGA